MHPADLTNGINTNNSGSNNARHKFTSDCRNDPRHQMFSKNRSSNKSHRCNRCNRRRQVQKPFSMALLSYGLIRYHLGLLSKVIFFNSNDLLDGKWEVSAFTEDWGTEYWGQNLNTHIFTRTNTIACAWGFNSSIVLCIIISMIKLAISTPLSLPLLLKAVTTTHHPL